MNQHLDYITDLVAKGGPDYHDYSEFDTWLNDVHQNYRSGIYSQTELNTLRSAFSEALSTATMQGHSFQKPFGYPGDFQVIDKIYQMYVCPQEHLCKWDIFYHQQKAAKAVRNRKIYFKELLKDLENAQPTSEIRVLDIAGGPARDVFEYLCCDTSGRVIFDCVDMDVNAIEFAGTLCASFHRNTNFINANAFRFRCTQKYDYIWSAGLFDYLNDRQFLFMLQRYLPCLKAGGSMVVGNFTTNNPTRPYMEIVNDWCLCHRDENKLEKLAIQAGFDRDNIAVGREPEKLNLFLHMQK